MNNRRVIFIVRLLCSEPVSENESALSGARMAERHA